MIAGPVFRYDDAEHAYYLDGARIPSITQLLELGGLVRGGEFFTEASRDRGTDVHRLCADLDLGVLDLARLDSPYLGYVMAYDAAKTALRPVWDAIEVADVHPGLRFAGRPDRLGTVFGRRAVVELKTGGKSAPVIYQPTGQVVTAHGVQTALQATLVGRELPAPMWARYTVYLKPSGKFTVETHTDGCEFTVANDLIGRHCR